MATPIRLSRCTMTGVDENTPLDFVADLSDEHPFAEWGFIYLPKQQGQGGRFPSVDFISQAFSSLPGSVHVALHVCGHGVQDLLSGDPVASALVDQLEARNGRLQLNFNHKRKPLNFDLLSMFIRQRHRMQVITQFHGANTMVWEMLQELPNHAVLFDSSGGQGLSPETWHDLLPGVSCGYSGGLGPDNLHQELERIAAVVGGNPIWVDMEGKLRTRSDDGSDWFDLEQCAECLRIASSHLFKEAVPAQDQGWWVPIEHWNKQKLWSKTGCWQIVRGCSGIPLRACLLHGEEGWWDGNYRRISGITEWLKPVDWFDGPNDESGRINAWEAYKQNLPKSPLR